MILRKEYRQSVIKREISFFKYDSITPEQLNTIQELVNHDILSNGIIGNYTDEFIRCDLLNKFYNGEIDYEKLPERTNKIIQVWRE